LARLAADRVVLPLHHVDSFPMRSFGNLLSLLPLLGILSSTINLLMCAVFDGTHVRFQSLTLYL
jgi:hypothetical protein